MTPIALLLCNSYERDTIMHACMDCAVSVFQMHYGSCRRSSPHHYVTGTGLLANNSILLIAGPVLVIVNGSNVLMHVKCFTMVCLLSYVIVCVTYTSHQY